MWSWMSSYVAAPRAGAPRRTDSTYRFADHRPPPERGQDHLQRSLATSSSWRRHPVDIGDHRYLRWCANRFDRSSPLPRWAPMPTSSIAVQSRYAQSGEEVEMNIGEIARRAGVSRSTVSYALSRRRAVSP